ncbi:MAG: diguanylate cyclase [Clostridiaceae bacterium]|nr:diguanylate cyclase [Clostridiaceae bacterium]NBH78369.1 diguanylate cyclase [Clostridiaceae bacterium]NBI81072.1 diguanylate cyclase [Clostridiaceae bacterium]
MQKFSPLAYIRKFQILIILGALLAGLVFYEYFAGKQSYTVSAIIEYTNARASEGFSPDGKEIDTSEIYSVPVMQDVFSRMGLDYDSYNLDQFRSRVSVEPILSEEEKAMQEAQNDAGEESTVKATKYMVSFYASRSDSDQPANFARQVLDNMLDAFLAYYAENHIGGGAIVSNLSGLNDGSYDYLEMAEIIDQDVQDTQQSLYNRVASLQNSPLYYYRSTLTGHTFMDLYREFDIIAKTDIPNLYAYILNNRASRDQGILISKYQKRIEDYKISNSASTSQSEAITDIIASYVRMMRESGNTDITYEYILNDVDDDYFRYMQQSSEENTSNVKWERPDETVKYDVLLEDYVKNRTSVEYDKINIAYCQYIIEVFTGAVNASGEAVAQDARTAVPEPNAGATAEAMLDSVVTRLNELYRLLDRTMVEYNEYAGAANISLGSNVVLQPGMKLVLYSGIVSVVFAVMLSIAVIVLSRVGEIFHYHVYMDHKFQIPNRGACDRYMEGYSNRILPEHISCVAITADNVRDKNEQYGVEACDAMLRKLIEILQSAFASVGDSFISVNGLGQFIVFAKSTSYGQAEACMQYAASVAADYNENAECKIEYRYGIAESKSDALYQIKALLMKAIEKCANARLAEGGAQDAPAQAAAEPVQELVQEPDARVDALLRLKELRREREERARGVRRLESSYKRDEDRRERDPRRDGLRREPSARRDLLRGETGFREDGLRGADSRRGQPAASGSGLDGLLDRLEKARSDR